MMQGLLSFYDIVGGRGLLLQCGLVIDTMYGISIIPERTSLP